MAYVTLGSLLVLASAALVLARPQESGSLQLRPGCSESAMFRCVSPVISFVMSSDGQRLMKIRKSGAVQQPDFDKVCRYEFSYIIKINDLHSSDIRLDFSNRLTQTTAGCMNTWIKKCVPEDAGDLHILGQGTVDLLGVCDEPNSFDEFQQFASCAEKMNTTMKSCGERLRAGLPQTGTFNHETPKRILNRENLQRDVCW